MRKFYLLLLLFLLLSSCNKNDDCAATDPPVQSIQISIIDSEGNSLIGENKIYNPSEIKLSRENQNIHLIFDEYNGETYIVLYYSEMESEKDYQLKLNDQETDILSLKIKTYNTDCFTGLKSVQKFLLNGLEIQRDNESFRYIIQK